MKRVISLFCVASIVSSPFVAYAQEGETKQMVEEIQMIEDGQTENKVEESKSLDQVQELTLEDIIRRGTENSTNLTVLQLNLEVMKNEINHTNYDKNRATRDIKRLEDRIDDLKDEKEGLTGEARTENFEDRAEYLDSIDSLEKEIEALETSIQKIESGQLQLQLQEEEIKEGVKLMLTSSYLNLLLLQDQIDYKKKSVQSTSNEVNKYQLLYNLGRVSQEQLYDVNMVKENEERQLLDMEKNYRYALADLSFDIGIAYDPDIVIKSISFEVANFERPADFSPLIEDSYQMKRARKDLETAILDRDQVYKEYEKGDATKYEKENQDYFVLIAEETFASTKDDLQRTMEQLYREAENSYLSYQEAVRQLEIKRKEIENLQIRYNLGRVSKYDYEQTQLGLEAAELNVYQTEIQNYKIQQSIQALQKGYI